MNDDFVNKYNVIHIHVDTSTKNKYLSGAITNPKQTNPRQTNPTHDKP